MGAATNVFILFPNSSRETYRTNPNRVPALRGAFGRENKIMKLKHFLGRSALTPMLVFLFGSAVYLYGFPQATVFYAGIVLCHALVGTILSIYLLVFLFRLLRQASIMARLGWILIAASAGVGLALIKLGTSRPEWNFL